MILMAVHAAVGNQAEEMQALALLAAWAKAFFSTLFLRQRVFLDGLVDAGQVLVNDAAGAEVEVADLAVAHLAVGQADIHAAGADVAHG